jgi:2-keto-3-deoxy-L-rhamnonate aldolase RhmA
MTTFKEQLERGAMALGTMVSEVRNPNVAHLLARCGFEFMVIDNEHGSYSDETVSDMIAGARGAGMPVIVRIPEIRRATILKPLDAGAAGLLVPMVDSPEQAAEIVRHAKYPPLGQRGAAVRRPHSLYERVDPATYLDQANRETFIAVQAETRQAIENVDAIAAVEGVDCVFAGPLDLSIDLGIPGKLDHPDEIAALERMLQGCRAQGKIAGMQMFDAAMLRGWIHKGVQFVVYSGDVALLADAASKAVAELKACLS